MIQIIPCANCQKSMLLPLHVSLKATIECPSCSEKFVVGEMVTSKLGVWTIVEDPAPVSATQFRALSSAPVAHADSFDGELKLADEEPRKPAKTAADWSDFKPITHEQYEKLKRDARSPFWSVTQIVLGAVMAVPLSLFLIWNLLEKDVAGAGPFVASFAPWAVPEAFRGEQDAEEGEESKLAKGASDDAMDPTRGDYGGEEDYGDEDYGGEGDADMMMGEEEAEMFAADAGEESNSGYGEAMENGQASSGEIADSVATALGRPKGETKVTEAKQPSKKRKRSLSAGNSTASSSGQQMIAIPSIFSLMRQSDRHLDNWRVANRLQSKDLAELTDLVYQDLLELADGFTELPAGNPVLNVVRDALQPVGRDIKKYEALQDAVHEGANAVFSEQSGEEQFSVALIIDISDVNEERETWELMMEDGDEWSNELNILVPKFLAPSLNPGQRLLLLGQVVSSENSESEAPEGSTFTASYLHAL